MDALKLEYSGKQSRIAPFMGRRAGRGTPGSRAMNAPARSNTVCTSIRPVERATMMSAANTGGIGRARRSLIRPCRHLDHMASQSSTSITARVFSIVLIVIVGLLNFHIPHFFLERGTADQGRVVVFWFSKRAGDAPRRGSRVHAVL